MIETTNSSKQNTVLISTYYSGKETPSPQEISIPTKNKNIMWLPLLTGVFFLLLLVSAAAFAVYKLPIGGFEDSPSALSPVRYYGNISYYDYSDIQGSPQAITLKGNRSSAIINFATTKDLRGSVISFSAKGNTGSEKLAMVLSDANRMSNANQDDVILTPALPGEDWRNFKIELKNLYMPIDKARVQQIRFDCSDKLTGNESGSAVYIKNIIIE